MMRGSLISTRRTRNAATDGAEPRHLRSTGRRLKATVEKLRAKVSEKRATTERMKKRLTKMKAKADEMESDWARMMEKSKLAMEHIIYIRLYVDCMVLAFICCGNPSG